MVDWIDLGPGGLIRRESVLAVARVRSAPIKRLLSSQPERVLNMTYGYPKESVIVLDNGYLAIVSFTVEDLLLLLDDAIKEVHDVPF